MYMHNGMVLGIYRILGIATVLISMSGVLNETDDQSSRNATLDPSRAINIYSLLLPIAVFSYDLTV